MITFFVGFLFGVTLFFIWQKLQQRPYDDLETTLQKRIEEKGRAQSLAIDEKEKKILQQENDLKQRSQELFQKESEQALRQKSLKSHEELVQKEKKKIDAELSRLAKLSPEEARQELFAQERRKAKQELTQLETEANAKAMEMLLAALYRQSELAVSETSITTLSLPSSEMKGKMIGRDGRNIRAFEQAAGVTLHVDEDLLVISSYDAERRFVAKMAAEVLIHDGKINPQSIEATVQKVQTELPQRLYALGEEATDRANVPGLHPEVIKMVGKLKLRASFGQNMLDHSIEVSTIMGTLAAELQLDERLARRIGLLHDIGKVITDKTGSHAIVGGEFVKKWGEKESVVNGIQCHHDEVSPSSFEAGLCKLADSLSARRAGARTQNEERHIERLRALEEAAEAEHDVERAYAVQAGRELRVIVSADRVSDERAEELAELLAEKIEATSASSHRVQVTVLREKKVTTK